MTGNRMLLVSATELETARLVDAGPRRDFLALAADANAEVRYQPGARRKGLVGKLVGPHIRQAWDAARDARDGDVLFADGEHNGIPLQLFLALRRRRGVRTVMLGHLLSRRWKLPLLWAATRLGTRGTIVLHSVEQERIVRRWASGHWRIRLAPYQVDTGYWTPEIPALAEDARPLILAVGSENRDYETLVRAVDGLPVRLLIAAGSHWARETATSSTLPSNVEYTGRPLPFAELREQYRRAAMVVVPVHDVPNQSGVTTILEAMSCARPVVVTASRGQRECVIGPLVHGDGTFDARSTRDRGPSVFGGKAAERTTTGLYVPPADQPALRAAIEHLLGHPQAAAAMGRAARRSVVANFDVSRYAATLAAHLGLEPGRPEPLPELREVPA